MTDLKKKIAAVTLGAALTVTGLLGGLMLNNSAITASADENDGIMTVSHVLETPSVNTPEPHTCLVAYPIIQNDDECDRIRFKYEANEQYYLFSLTYHEVKDEFGSYASDCVRYYIVPSTTTSETCYPYAKVFRSYCDSCGQYSDYCYTLRTLNADADYPITGKSSSTTTITTSYTTFSHTSDNASVYKFSIAYKGSVADGKVTTSGTPADFVINGVTFTVKATASGISIKANTVVGCNSYDTMFAYYLIS